MAWIDLLLILVIICYALSGLVRGFLKTSTRFGGSLFSLCIAILLAPTLASLFIDVLHLNSDLGIAINAVITPYCVSSSGGALDHSALHQFAQMMYGHDYWINYVGGVESPEFIAKISFALADSVLILLSFFIIFAILRIVWGLVCGLIRALNRKRVFGWVARSTGALVGVLEGILIVVLILSLIHTITPVVPAFGNIIQNLLTQNPVTNWMYGLLNDFLTGVLLPWMIK